MVQERNRLKRSASEQSPQVQTLTTTLDDLAVSIRQALSQARHSTELQRNSIQGQYTKYQGRIGSTPEQERILNQIGRQQEVHSGSMHYMTAASLEMSDEPQNCPKGCHFRFFFAVNLV